MTRIRLPEDSDRPGGLLGWGLGSVSDLATLSRISPGPGRLGSARGRAAGRLAGLGLVTRAPLSDRAAAGGPGW
jgi:hypothetical protein